MQIADLKNERDKSIRNLQSAIRIFFRGFTACQNLFFCDILITKILKNLLMPDQAQKTRPVTPGPSGGGDGPSAPKVDKPNTEELLKRMRKVDPDQARRYRQRTGQ